MVPFIIMTAFIIVCHTNYEFDANADLTYVEMTVSYSQYPRSCRDQPVMSFLLDDMRMTYPGFVIIAVE